MEFLFGGHKWVFTMHIFVGPLLALIAYFAYERCFNNKFKNYDSVIRGLLIAQMIIGIVVVLYHSYRLAQNNGLI
tara:strand:- start:308 stop:532 length:225 start_codon:yes stop_codon:yes gene_type:complete